jgi:hypothetical protein
MNTLYAVSQELPVEIRPVSGKVKRRCALCLHPFTDGHGDVCAKCWSFIPHKKMTTWDWAIVRGVSARRPEVPGYLKLADPGWPLQSIMPPEPRHGLVSLNGSAPPSLIIKPTFPEIRGFTEHNWDRVPGMGLRSGLAFDVMLVVREGTLHVKCAMPGCSSEYVSNENPASKVRYVCSHHTNAQLRRARILKTDREDRDVRLDDPKYRFNYKKPQESPEWSRSSWAFKDWHGHQSNAQYAADYNGRNDSDRGNSPRSLVHRPNKSAPFAAAYAPVDPVKILGFRRSVWDKPVFPVQFSELGFIWRVIHYSCNSKLVGMSLVPYIDPFLLSRSVASFLEGSIYPQSAWIKCTKCGLEVERVMTLTAAEPKEWLCPYCDPDKSKDDVEHRESPFLAARRGKEGEAIEDPIPADTLAQERRLDEIITRWEERIKFAKKRNLIDEPTEPRKGVLKKSDFYRAYQPIIEFLKKDKNFALDVADFKAIDEGEKLPDKKKTKDRRDRMRIINSSIMDAVHPDLNWNQLLNTKEVRQHSSGVFLVVKRERWRRYYLGPLDMPTLSPLGLPINPINLAFSQLLIKSVMEARKAARKHKLDENEAAERAFQQFMTGEVIWVRAPRSQKIDRKSA